MLFIIRPIHLQNVRVASHQVLAITKSHSVVFVLVCVLVQILDFSMGFQGYSSYLSLFSQGLVHSSVLRPIRLLYKQHCRYQISSVSSFVVYKVDPPFVERRWRMQQQLLTWNHAHQPRSRSGRATLAKSNAYSRQFMFRVSMVWFLWLLSGQMAGRKRDRRPRVYG